MRLPRKPRHATTWGPHLETPEQTIARFEREQTAHVAKHAQVR